MINKYLQYIQEGENQKVYDFRKNNKFMWLYHGTRIPRSVLEKQGILVSKTKAIKEFIYVTSIKKYAQYYTSKFVTPLRIPVPLSKKGNVLLVKLDTKFLEFRFRGKLLMLKDAYRYTKDIPPKDILFPGDPEYKVIEDKYEYLQSIS